MARLDEIAHGLTLVLSGSTSPEPLPVNLLGQSPSESVFLIQQIVLKCERMAVPRSVIRVGGQVGEHASRVLLDKRSAYQGITVEVDYRLERIIELYRYPIA